MIGEDGLDAHRLIAAKLPVCLTPDGIFLGEIGDKRAVGALVAAMPDWETRWAIGAALERLGWQPSSEREKVYLWIGWKKASELTRAWEQTRRVLLEDIRSQEQRRVDNAMFTLIALGRDEMVPQLITALEQRGHEAMAAAYIHCGHDMLAAAAKAWARGHRDVTLPSSDLFPSWGQWR